MSALTVTPFFDEESHTFTYVVSDHLTKDAILIDPVLLLNLETGELSPSPLKAAIDFIRSKNLTLRAVLETHAHADHVSGSQVVKDTFPQAELAIGKHIIDVQKTFVELMKLESVPTNGAQFDHLFEDGEVRTYGTIKIKAIFTPGHTPACACYLIQDLLFTGDCLFMPDAGTGRCDFPGGSAENLYKTVTEKLFTLPDSTKVFVGHDYAPGGRSIMFETTIGESKKSNIHLGQGRKREDFVQLRESRDKTLTPPKLLSPSIQVNINGGKIPSQEAPGKIYKVPLRLSRAE